MLLLGIIAAPLVPAGAVGLIGALVGRARDRGISDDLIKQAGAAIETHGAVVFVLADQANSQAIGKLIDEAAAGGATVEYEVLSEDAQDLLRMQLKTGGKVGVGAQMDFNGATLEQYDEIVKQMGFERKVRASQEACSTGSRRPLTGSGWSTSGRTKRSSTSSPRRRSGRSLRRSAFRAHPKSRPSMCTTT